MIGNKHITREEIRIGIINIILKISLISLILSIALPMLSIFFNYKIGDILVLLGIKICLPIFLISIILAMIIKFFHHPFPKK